MFCCVHQKRSDACDSQSESIQSSGGVFVLNGRGEIALSQISIAVAL